jgi:hypothetical protein
MGKPMSEARWQNIINTLQERRFKLMLRITELQAVARRAAFEAVTADSWKAKQTFRDVEHEADRLASEVNILDLALAEAYERTQRRDWKDVMAELMGELSGIGELRDRRDDSRRWWPERGPLSLRHEYRRVGTRA